MIPEHCTNPECRNFNNPEGSSWFLPYGSYETATFGTVNRFKCRLCGRTFSEQSFSIDYYAKKEVDYTPILDGLKTGSGNRDIARHLCVRNETVQNRIERLSRWAQGIQHTLLPLFPFNEDFVADGLQSFSQSQYYPNDINIFVGKRSQFLYTCGLSVLRRKGRMTEAQKKKRIELEKKGKADPAATKKSMKILGEWIDNFLVEKKMLDTVLWTDMHNDYVNSFSGLVAFIHRRISSKAARNHLNPLMAVNYYDREVRKDLSDHTRETVQFARHPACMMSRFVLYRHHHNFLKPFRINSHDENSSYIYWTHAEEAGMLRQDYKALINKMQGKRFFLNKLTMNEEEMKTWLHLWRNPGVKSKRYVPQYIRA